MKNLIALAALASLALLLATACGDDATPKPTPTSAAPRATFEDTACGFELPKDQPPELVRCGFLTVPEQRDVTNDRTVRLAVAVLKSTSATPAPDPLVYLQGGPCCPGVEFLWSQEFAGPVQAKRDIIFFDYRGTGRSQPALTCPEVKKADLEAQGTNGTVEESTAAHDAALFACRDRLQSEGVNFAAYTSAANAADLHDLMTTLGYKQWNIYGSSYGTRLGLSVMRDWPDDIRSVILDGTLAHQADKDGDGARTLNRSQNQMFADCAADAACHAAYPNLETDIPNLVAKLDANPITVYPENPATGEKVPVVIDGAALLGGEYSVFYDASLLPIIPFAIHEIANENYGLVTELAGGIVFQFAASADALYTTVECSEQYAFLTDADVTAANAGVPEYIVRALSTDSPAREAAFCARWGATTAPLSDHEPVSSDLPTLILEGTYDPVTPYGKLTGQTLPNSFFVEFPQTGHGVIFARPACAMPMLAAFLDDPATHPDTACAAMIKPTFQVP